MARRISQIGVGASPSPTPPPVMPTEPVASSARGVKKREGGQLQPQTRKGKAKDKARLLLATPTGSQQGAGKSTRKHRTKDETSSESSEKDEGSDSSPLTIAAVVARAVETFKRLQAADLANKLARQAGRSPLKKIAAKPQSGQEGAKSTAEDDTEDGAKRFRLPHSSSNNLVLAPAAPASDSDDSEDLAAQERKAAKRRRKEEKRARRAARDEFEKKMESEEREQ